jgi:hypothetical protein
MKLLLLLLLLLLLVVVVVVVLLHRLQFLDQCRIRLGQWAYIASFAVQIYLPHLFFFFKICDRNRHPGYSD